MNKRPKRNFERTCKPLLLYALRGLLRLEADFCICCSSSLAWHISICFFLSYDVIFEGYAVLHSVGSFLRISCTFDVPILSLSYPIISTSFNLL